MRRHGIITTALVAMLVAGGLQAPAPAAPAAPAAPEAAPEYGTSVTKHIVKTKFGKMFVRVAHPTLNGKVVTAPSIFTYSPYWSLGVGKEFRRSANDSWVPKGYNAVWGDVVGTGNSGGCYDYGGDREKVRLSLPLVNPPRNAMDLFDMGSHPAPTHAAVAASTACGARQVRHMLRNGNNMETVALRTFYLEMKAKKKTYKIGEADIKIKIQPYTPAGTAIADGFSWKRQAETPCLIVEENGYTFAPGMFKVVKP